MSCENAKFDKILADFDNFYKFGYGCLKGMTQNMFFIYGLCTMFYFMMSWLFFKKNREKLSRLVGVLMLVLGIQCIKDILIIYDSEIESFTWKVMTAVDMVVIPLYAFILLELCRPGAPAIRILLVHEIPFLLLPALFILSGNYIFYFANIIWGSIYGFGYATWAVFRIPKYHRVLKEHFSYKENINLNWLRYILLSFVVILVLWMVDCVIINLNIESLYMLGSLTIWMFICYFIYKHESVVEELKALPQVQDNESEESDIALKITALFENDKVYLNPNLRLSDIASLVGTNRTYVSRFFNNECKVSFFDFVNGYRVSLAKSILKESSDKIDSIAEKTGFNSRQSFYRVFTKMVGMPPEKYRALPDNL